MLSTINLHPYNAVGVMSHIEDTVGEEERAQFKSLIGDLILATDMVGRCKL